MDLKKLLVEPEVVPGRVTARYTVEDAVVNEISELLKARKGKPFLLPVKNIVELTKYSGKAKASSMVWSLNKVLRQKKIDVFSKSGGKFIGFRVFEPTE